MLDPDVDGMDDSDILSAIKGLEPTQGPRQPRCPCTISQKACKTESIACDDCDKWTHRNCIGMSTTEFSNLGKSDIYVVYCFFVQ
jgi:hypothetical protein